MAAKLSVIFFITLCLEVGIVLLVFPWYNLFGPNDWGDNFLLLYAARRTGLWSLQQAVSSGWVRGAVSGLGVLNILMAFWEIAHFDRTVAYLQGQSPRPVENKDAAQPANADQLSHHERRDDVGEHSNQ